MHGWLKLWWFLGTMVCSQAYATQSVAEFPKVVVSIRPLQLLVSSLTAGEIQPQTLLAPGDSPHDYAFRPSDIRKLRQADLIIWIGPPLEQFLDKLLNQQASLPAIALTDLPGMPLRHHQESSMQQHFEHQDSDDHHDIDPHLWLGPTPTALAATHIISQLSALQPQRAEHYQLLLLQFLQRLEHTRLKLREQLLPVADQGYFVFHDAYGYFEQEMGIKPLGSFTINPQHRPGAHTLAGIRRQLVAHQARCVFAEPQFRPELLASMVEGTTASVAIVDPLGSNIPIDADGYFRLLEELGEQLLSCLRPNPPPP